MAHAWCRLFYLCIFSIMLFPGVSGCNAQAQTQQSGFWSDVKSAPGAIFQSERSVFARDKLGYWGVGTAAIVLAYAFDADVDGYVRREQPWQSGAKRFDKWGKQANDFLWAGLYLAGKISGQPALSRLGYDIIIAEVGANLVAQSLWLIVGRQRPQYSDNRHTFSPMDFGNLEPGLPPFARLPSFPSVHAAGNFSIAGVMTAHYGWRASLPFYAFGAAVGWSRIAREGHYLSDIVAGALLGSASGFAAVKYRKHRNTSRNARKINAVPVLAAAFRGITIRYNF